MTSENFLQTLTEQYAAGYIDVSALEDDSYTSVFDQLGIKYKIFIRDSSGRGWQQPQNAPGSFYFNGSIDVDPSVEGDSSILGLPAGTTLEIMFSPVSGYAEKMNMNLSLHLPETWVFGQSLPLLKTNLYNNLHLLDPSTHLSLLIVEASVIAPPPLRFSGYIDQNSSVITILSWFISGGIQNPVQGVIDYDATTGTVDMNLPLATSTVTNLFGQSGPVFHFTLSLYSGLSQAIGFYDSGVLFEADITIGQMTFPMNALYTSSAPSSLTFGLGQVSIDFETGIAAVESLIGHSIAIRSMLPPAIEKSSLVIEGVSFQVNIQTQQLITFSVGVSALENDPWEIWPGLLTLSDIRLSFLVYNPLSTDYIYDFTFLAETVFGGGNGLPMTITGKLPGLSLYGNLSADSYNLVPLLEQVFGSSKGLPQELEIVALDFTAGIANSVYAFDIKVAGYWNIPFGTDSHLTFRQITIAMGYTPDLGAYGSLYCAFAVKGELFSVELDLAAANVRLLGTWENEDAPIDYEDIAIALGMYGLPNLPPELDLSLTAASFELETAGPSMSFTLTSKNYGSATLIAGKDGNGNWGFIFGMVAGLELSINLTDIDVVGNFVPQGMDVIAVNNLRFIGATSAIPLYTPTHEQEIILGTQVNSGLVLSIDLSIGSLFSQTFSVRYGGLDDGTASDTPPPPINNNTPQPDVQAPAPSAPAALPGPTASWINVQRAFGPVHISRIGFRINDDQSLGILLDGEVTLAGLSIGLTGLEADVPVSAPFWPSFSLSGLEIGYVSPGLTLAGALVKTYGATPAQYTGELIFQAGSFGASAFGSYTTVNNDPSLFAFLSLNIPIGGPPFCVVTGLSAGFGYNRRLILPTIETVQTYPLVQAAMGITDPNQTIAALDRYIVPAQNQYWLAAGIRFTSFEMLTAYALLTASFGTQVELALMGEALLTLPIAVPGQSELILAQADMVLLASVNPSLGQLAVDAQLTSRSYVLDRNAHITGGFALYFWFGNNTHKGDFAVSLGGYNPYFTLPSYYPRVPLLGLNWQVSSLISIKGGLYCALTPSVIMAGGNLSASYASGDVKAWFNANADFLIRFKPFYFEATIAVSVGASYKLNLLVTSKTVSVTVGASLKLWGPPFAGTVMVDLTVMSFTIGFGAAKNKPSSSIGWDEFRNSFLPPEPGTLQQSQQLEVIPSVTATPTQSLVTFNAERGMIGSLSSGQVNIPGVVVPEGQQLWRMSPGKSAITISTAIPSKTLNVSTNAPITVSLSGISTSFGIGPMSLQPSDVGVSLEVKIYRDGNPDSQNWTVELLKENIPAGLWLNTTNSMNGNALVKNVLGGIRLVPSPLRPDKTATLSAGRLINGQLPDQRYWSWSPVVPPSVDYFAQGMSVFQSSLESPTAVATRTEVLSILQAQGLDVYTEEEIDLDGYVSDAQNILYAAPRICYLGETNNSSQALYAWAY